MLVKTVTPETTSITIEVPAEFVGKNIRVTAAITTVQKSRSAKSVEEVRERYSKFPKVDLSKFKFDRDEANDFD